MRFFDKILKKNNPGPDARSGEWVYDQDAGGNHWYLNRIGQMIRDGALVVGGAGVSKIDFDFRRDADKAVAARLCPPFARVFEKCGNMLSNGRYYVVDDEGNEDSRYEGIRMLLKNPNPLQDGKTFLKSVERTLKIFGYCPIYAPRGLSDMPPPVMYVIPPQLLSILWSGEYFGLTKSDMISAAFVDFGDSKFSFDEKDYFIIFDGDIILPPNKNEGIKVHTIADSLTHPVNNWMAQIIARKNLIVDGGPKGILHKKTDASGMGNSMLTPAEKNRLQIQFKRRYGIVNKADQILITDADLGWIELSFKTADLMLHEEDKSCQEHIANAIGLNPNVFISDSTFSNQESAKRSAYEDLIIPDAEKIAGALTERLCPEGIRIAIDYTHLSCMQEDLKAKAQSMASIASALDKLEARGTITRQESRIELSNYIDINPEDNGKSNAGGGQSDSESSEENNE